MKVLIVTLLLLAVVFAQRRERRPIDTDREQPSDLSPRDMAPRETSPRNLPPRRPVRDQPTRETPPEPLPPRRKPTREPPQETPPPPLRPRRTPREEPPSEEEKSPITGLNQFDMYLNGFHLDPLNHCHQVEAQHYCQELNDDITQCILLNKDGSRLQGVEYIVTRELFNELPEQEKSLWHSHKFEVKSGALFMVPNATDSETINKAADKYVDSYGKIFMMFDDKEDFPYGSPRLMMSFTRKGQLLAQLLQKRNARFQIDEDKMKNLTSRLRPRALIKGADMWETGVSPATGVVPVRVVGQDFKQCPALVGAGDESANEENTEDTTEEDNVARRSPTTRTQPSVSHRIDRASPAAERE